MIKNTVGQVENRMRKPNIAVLGATGVVGREILKILVEIMFLIMKSNFWPVQKVPEKK